MVPGLNLSLSRKMLGRKTCGIEIRGAQSMKVDEEKLLTVDEVAGLLQVKSSWVYSHSENLGALRIGKYLRFSWSRVLLNLTGVAGSPTRRPNSNIPESSTCNE